MQLAKPRMDFGLSTNDIEPMLAFWQGEVGLPFDHLLKIRRGQDQHRHDALGSVIKINHLAEPLPQGPPTGYRELYLAREGLPEPRPILGNSPRIRCGGALARIELPKRLNLTQRQVWPIGYWGQH